MSCCNFGREDEEFLFSEKLKRFFEGIDPSFGETTFKVETKREGYLKRFEAFRRAFLGAPEEPFLEAAVGLFGREFAVNGQLAAVVENLFFPFLERLLFFKVNAPEGESELEGALSLLEELLELKVKGLSLESRVELSLNALTRLLYELTEAEDD